jgi:hypothetical protein
MTCIKAAHYNETEQRLTNDPIVQQLASEIPWNVINERFTNDAGEPTFDFMMRANEEYRFRGGEDGGHIGAIANAIISIVEAE